jgi:hypothetical protein
VTGARLACAGRSSTKSGNSRPLRPKGRLKLTFCLHLRVFSAKVVTVSGHYRSRVTRNHATENRPRNELPADIPAELHAILIANDTHSRAESSDCKYGTYEILIANEFHLQTSGPPTLKLRRGKRVARRAHRLASLCQAKRRRVPVTRVQWTPPESARRTAALHKKQILRFATLSQDDDAGCIVSGAGRPADTSGTRKARRTP